MLTIDDRVKKLMVSPSSTPVKVIEITTTNNSGRVIDERVRGLLRSPSSVKNNKEVTRIIDKKDLYKTNKALEAQLEANRQARINENIAIQEKIMMMEEEFDLYGAKEN